MPVITEGSSADVVLSGNSTLTIQNPTGFATVEFPIGTVVWKGGQANKQLDLNNGTARITANTGSVTYYASSDPVSSVVQRNLGNTVYLAGDSLTNNCLTQTGTPINFVNRGSEGWFNTLDASLGAPFTVLGSVAAGGKTTADMLATQLPTVIAASPKYCAFTIGNNDINVSLLSGEATAAAIIQVVQTLLDAGITPIWSTVFPQAYDSVVTPKVTKCNDILRTFAATNPCGLFFDGYMARVDSTNSQNPSKGATYSYDATAYLHPNNLGALTLGLFAASQIGGFVLKPSAMSSGNEDVTYNNGSNLLSNPGFTGTTGTVSANCTGTMPTGWVIDWPTRTGTGSAAAAIVNVTDAASGLVIGQQIQVTISGACAANDVVRIYQSDTQNAAMRTSISAGNVIQCEGVVSLATAANVSSLAIRVQSNTNESTWANSNGQTAGTFPATVPNLSLRSYPMTVLGSGVATQARYDLRVTFNGAGTGTVINLSRPRFRKVS